MTDFIGVYPKAMPDDLCDHLVAQFDASAELGLAVGRKTEMNNEASYRTFKDDSVVFSYEIPMQNATTKDTVSAFIHFLQSCYVDYADKFSASLGNTSEHTSYMFKLQKTEVGQGYHVWHFEAGARDVCTRILAWTVYLNDVEEGGETEFLYQHKRVKPEKGTVCIFPAAFTHTHRGNPPLSNTKYIATGWYEY
jgi:hypothetical protein